MKLNLEPHFVSMIRFAFAAVAGTVVRIIANKWAYDIDGETLASASTAVAIVAYYAAVKLIERRWPKATLLGLADPDTKT